MIILHVLLFHNFIVISKITKL